MGRGRRGKDIDGRGWEGDAWQGEGKMRNQHWPQKIAIYKGTGNETTEQKHTM